MVLASVVFGIAIRRFHGKKSDQTNSRKYEYAHDETAGVKQERAKRLVEELWVTRTGCLSVQVLQEVYVTLSAKVPKRLDPAIASAIVTDLSRWHVHVPGPDDVVGAIALHRQYQIGFSDAMIRWSAQQLGCAVVWSEDLNPGQTYDGTRVRNPFPGEMTGS